MTTIKMHIAAVLAILAGVGLGDTASATTPAVLLKSVGSTLTVAKAGSGLGTVTSNVGVINCGVTCSDTYADNTVINLTATPAAGSQFTGWLGPCTGAGTCNFAINGATAALATFASASLDPHTLDIDGTASYDALTDGLLVVRYLSGLSGESLVGGAVGPGAARFTDTQILGYLTDIKPALDIDGNGQADAQTDGQLIMRYLLGLRGDSLIAGAVGPGATRGAFPDIQTQIQSLLAAFPPPAVLAWSDTPLDAAISSMAIAPDGVGLFFGFPLSGIAQLAIRPVGGPIGAPQAMPPGLSTPSVLGFAANGDALLAYSWYLAFRPAGAASAVGTPQTLPLGYRFLKSMAVTATGEALVGTDDGFATSGTARVFPRAAGAAAVADTASAQTFASATPAGSYVTLLGLALDPDGGAVAVFSNWGALGLVQAVRASGETIFHPPTQILNPAGVNAEMYRVVFAYAPDGHAVLAWIGSTTTLADDRIIATYRAPGGAFGAPQVVASTSIYSFSTVSSAMAAGGDGMLVWSQPVFQHSTCNDYQATASILHGGGFSLPVALGPGSFPNTSIPLAIAGAGDRVAVAIQTNDLGGSAAPCNGLDDSIQMSVRTYKRRPGGLGLEDEHVVASSQPSPGPASFYHPFVSSVGLRLGASGTLAIGTSINISGVVSTLHVRE